LAKRRKVGWIEKPEGKPFYRFGVKIDGRRHFRSTGKTTEREAEGERDRCYQEILADIAETKAASVRTSERPLETLGEAIDFYWTNVGQFHDGGVAGASLDDLTTGAANTLWSLDWLRTKLGTDMKLALIDAGVVQQVKSWRRAEPSKNSKRGEAPKPVANATVNRSVIQPLRKVLLHAEEFGHATIAKINWSEKNNVLMAEPEERVRELDGDEEIRLFDHLRADYQPLIDVAIILGLRQAEAIVKLRWHHIGWGTLTITIPGKGNKTDVMQLPLAARDILWKLRDEVKPERDDELVFTYVAQRSQHPSANARRTIKDVRVAGQRYPITKSGLRREFTRAIRAAGIINFRYHDLRHTFASRMLRAPGSDLKQVQKQLRHRQITTTMKYAHVRDQEMRASMDAAAAASPRRAAAAGTPQGHPGEDDARRDTPKDTPAVG
jgi:integrase